MDKIYTVTTLMFDPDSNMDDPGVVHLYYKRVVGWFLTLEIAEEVVMHNEGNINEAGQYDHSVIEEAHPGLYPHISREEWFKWIGGRYILISKPKGLDKSTNIGIG